MHAGKRVHMRGKETPRMGPRKDQRGQISTHEMGSTYKGWTGFDQDLTKMNCCKAFVPMMRGRYGARRTFSHDL
jgi:hypothetical protein